MPNNNDSLGEARKLTAAWLNIMAASLISAGLIPVFTALAVDGWGARARSLALLPALAVSAGTALHMIGRLVLRETKLGPPLRMSSPYGVVGGVSKAEPGDDGSAFPTERDIDNVLEEFADDARAAIRALLKDIDSLAHDQATNKETNPQGERSNRNCRG